MVIISNKSGQLGNRLFLFAHFIANAKEFHYEVSNPSFYDYAHYFANIQSSLFCGYPKRDSDRKAGKFVQGAYFEAIKALASLSEKLGLQGRTVKVLNLRSMKRGPGIYDLAAPEFLEAERGTRFLLAKGFLYRDPANFDKHAGLIREFFAPAQHHAANIARLMEKARQDCDLLVGVHIRQGDYRKWKNGRYFYESEDYARMMRRYSSQCDRRVRFLICSNAAQDERVFEGIDYIFGNGQQVEDMYSFAQCDLLIGPPSTYTQWASFYGSVPFYTMESAGDPIAPEDFRIYGGGINTADLDARISRDCD